MLRRLILACGLACPALAAQAGEVRSGEVVVRYNALPTANLPAESARRYGLVRSQDQGLVIVAVSRASDDGDVAATVSGRASTLIGSPVPVTFRRVEESGSVSWLGTFQVPSPGALRFSLDVTPTGAATQHVEFVQDF
ncbi:hypothetical protein FHW69_001975 [Luteibacter sp. Sphag1AF]|uniref:DUF4426 domain-containing protein n=1 Tax=Luteibacter sp. Sphag1AF TaxID=2587031 RepID=UPI00160D89AD|nr:DUF4426 domain-containing protein [Luteibacter sp. Sphag1AF]MBB3227352.1 hypothetical protein [Luteibacter sp. Sphag1AF]